MLGNLSQTIVKVPTFFHLLAKLSSKEFKNTRYREPPLIDTFSQLKKINHKKYHRYFKLNEHFKETAPYKDLNYNNNKRYISPVTKLPIRSFHQFLFSEYDDFNPKLKRNISQEQIISNSKFNPINLSNNINNDNNIKIENNRYNISNEINKEDNKHQDKNEEQLNNKENNNEIDNKEVNNDEENNEQNNDVDDEQKKIEKYLQKLRKIKPNNLKELREYLDIKYMDDSKKNINVLPKIRRMNKSLSQDDLFKQTIDKKIESLTTIKPEIRNSIYERAKNIMLKRDYDLLHKVYANHKKFHFKHKKNNENNNFKN